jgi:phage baseplate assembly protein W
MYLGFPYRFDGRGRTAESASLDAYVATLVEQVLFTSPGERVNLPDFGSGLLQLPFAPNSVEMAAATQFAVQGALTKWLSGYIRVISVTATAADAQLSVSVTYQLLNTDVTQVQTFAYPGESTGGGTPGGGSLLGGAGAGAQA